MIKLDRTKAPHETFEEYEIFFSLEPEHKVAIYFQVLQICGEQIEPVPGKLYERFDDATNEMTLKPEEADVFLAGFIKWDGCSDWEFPTQETCMLHFCGIDQATSIGRLMNRMYEIAAEQMPKFDRQCAGMEAKP